MKFFLEIKKPLIVFTFRGFSSSPDEMILKSWRRRADLNRWLYGFANRSLGPLGHVSKIRLSFGEIPFFVNQNKGLPT
jgi:hypothetical protein